jgi:hypothetical protein
LFGLLFAVSAGAAWWPIIKDLRKAEVNNTWEAMFLAIEARAAGMLAEHTD